MNKTFTRLLAALALGIGLAAGVLPASAAPVSQTFTLTPDFVLDSVGSLSGSFSYDDAAVDPAAADQLISLSSFDATLETIAYDRNDLIDDFAVYAFGQFIGLQVTIKDLLTVSPQVGGQASSFAYVGPNGSATGEAVYQRIGTVPEPGVAVLALLALGALGLHRRRQTGA